MEIHRFRPCLSEYVGKPVGEALVGLVVRPEPEDATGLEMSGEGAEPFGPIEAGTAIVEERVGRVVYVDQNGIEAAAGGVRIKSGLTAGDGKEVALYDPTTLIAHQFRTKRQQTRPVPVDHRLQNVDDNQRTDSLVIEDGLVCAADAEPADDNVEAATGERDKTEPGQRDLGSREQARHKVLVAERQLAPAPEAQRTDRRRSIVQLLEQAHAAREPPRAAGGHADNEWDGRLYRRFGRKYQ